VKEQRLAKMPDEGPYRTPFLGARFVCLVCCRSLSTMPGRCPSCGVARLALDDPEVRAEVRRVAEERLQRRAYREYATLTAAIMIGSLMIYTGPLALAILPLWFGGVALYYARLRKRSAMAIMATRRRRVSKELGEDVQIGGRGMDGFLHDPVYMKNPEMPDAQFESSTEPDPETLDLHELLESMGARIEEA
jgi:hypothetical protein